MRSNDFDFHLPHHQIAQRPLERRDSSRLLLLDRERGNFEDRQFAEFPELLLQDDLLVLNNARVIPARLFGRREGNSSDKIEVLLVRQNGADTWECLVRPGKKMPLGARVLFGENELGAEVVGRGELGVRTLNFISRDSQSVGQHFERLGHVPLPPYIDRPDETSDRERYQTVFAKRPGAIAAPTAGLHFTPEILERIRAKGIEICELTLDVGLGTFQPVHSETLEGHAMHSESYEIPPETAEKLTEARAARRRIVAIGTTAVRALEDAAIRTSEAQSTFLLAPGKAEASLFILPGFRFRVVDALLTNFHLPKSTLLALVSSFAGRENVLAAYRHAVETGYRFYSYGDCMFIC